MLYRKITAVCSDIRTKKILSVECGTFEHGTYRNHRALRGEICKILHQVPQSYVVQSTMRLSCIDQRVPLRKCVQTDWMSVAFGHVTAICIDRAVAGPVPHKRASLYLPSSLDYTQTEFNLTIVQGTETTFLSLVHTLTVTTLQN
jgi:hypothetical protein